ncbi:hypothetical protein ANRL3_00224 [Anaerolineae bacterium]|nr:hypothetical protein ANRL3_00224 [Anaerolineae bacterium]
MKSAEFMRALPDAVRARLPKKLQAFKVTLRPWLVQFYYANSLLHYEVVTHGERRGLLEIGLHFESRNSDENARLLNGFMQHLFEIKAELGDQVEAEMWDKGWTKVYETLPLETMNEAYLERVAERLAHMIGVLQPILEKVARDA